MLLRILLALVCIPFSALSSLAQENPTKEQIRRWVSELGDNDFEVREKATQALWRAGRSAEAAVTEAAQSTDAEVSRRAQEVLDKFRWGIYVDTPPKVLDLIARYRATEPLKRTEVARQLYAEGGPGWAALIRIATAEETLAVRERLRVEITKSLGEAVPTLVRAHDLSTLDQLAELGAAAEVEGARAAFAAYLTLRGRLGEAIPRYQVLAARKDATAAQEVLVYLLRAQGDLPGARAIAGKLRSHRLLELLLSEQNDWKGLAALPLAKEDEQDLETLGFRAAYQRLAGDASGAAATLVRLRKLAESRADNDNELWMAAKSHFVNNRPQDALALLTRSPRGSLVTFEVLCAQMRYREAIAFAEGLSEKSDERPMVDIQRARALHFHGEKEKAQAVLGELAKRIKPGAEAPWEEKFVETEFRLGLTAAAQEHCALILAGNKNPGRVDPLLEKCFPGRGGSAGVWWRLLRDRSADESAQAILKRVADLIGGKVSEKELEDLVKEGVSRPNLPAEELETLLLAAAEASGGAGREAEIQKYLEQAMAFKRSSEPLLRLADRLAARKDWSAAAARYAEAWERQTQDPLPLWLRGHALAQAGKVEEGKKWQEGARLLPLGDEAVRFTFAEALERRGHRAAAAVERDLLLKTGGPHSFYAGEARRLAAFDAYNRGDHERAALLHERAVLRCISSGVSFAENGAYVAVPQSVHRLRARGHVAAGRIEEARREIDLCLALLPGDTDLPILLVPELEKKSEKQLASKVFDTCFEVHRGLCRDFPKSAWAHNSLAWMGAACRRQLDTALEHANKAVALVPDNASYHDTLGELYFQKGDREKALTHARRSVELAPSREYFRKQLRRIEAGNPMTDLPKENEEPK